MTERKFSLAGLQTQHTFGDVIDTWRNWWRHSVIGTVNQTEVIAGRREESDLSARYMFMLAMSAGIAILGLLLSSPAVVIGAMLLSPLMGPIIGLGFALATGDYQWIRQSSRSLAIGTVLSIVICAIIVVMSPLQTVTPEIAARTRPNLFDLLVALFSALAGAYAMIRGREGTVVGVAIATALMPPLAVVGFGLATLNWTVFSGALLLFVTNLMTIALTAAIMARLYGFSTRLSEKQTNYQSMLIAAAFIGLAVPLFLSLRQIGFEANASRQINAAVLDEFEARARISQIDPNFATDPISITGIVLTPTIRPDAERVIEGAIARRIGREVDLSLTQYKVGTGTQAAEEAQLAASRAVEEANSRRASQLAERLALVAGVSESDVLVDRQRRRAVVTARPLEGATLAAYRELEARIASSEPEWRIQLRPPARPLPAVAFDGDALTADGARALALIGWAGQRLAVPIVLRGRSDQTAQVAETLRNQGIVVQIEGGGGRGPVTAEWGAPSA